MGTRELILSVAAVALFAMATLTLNRLSNVHAEDLLQRQKELAAFSLAQDLVEEVKNKAFDENVLNNRPASLPTGFSTLGPSGGEVYPHFDDVDDYDGLNITVNDPMGPFQLSAEVDYVDDTAPDVPVLYPTFYKRLKVTVAGWGLPQPVEVRYVFAFRENY